MPASKHMLSRYQVINACFLTKYKKYWSIAELLNKLEENDISISIRTLKEDIAAMRLDDTLGYHAPIEYCAMNKGYYYTDPEYSINRITLNDEEIEILLRAINMIKAYKNINALSNFQSVVEKVVGHVNRRMISAKAAV
jgi:predicted DNA-binding transcriptional regulator YafY